ncbi:MAG: hypothetical protein H6841_07105 [Planctomycetes bacterium]|nr:hypothetical protein [Planctomycetota bacterium]MCB9935259.1 hypothetical protein [Planctomycetota bacterium]
MADRGDTPPVGFRAVVITAPARVDKYSLDDMLEGAADVMRKLREFAGHRIIFAGQITQADSSTVATLLDLSSRARKFGHEFVIVDPPKVLDNFLDIYLPGDDGSQHIFYSGKDDPAVCPVPWLPRFRPAAEGRVDVYDGSLIASYRWTQHGFEQT